MQRRNRRAGVEDRWTKTVRDEQGNQQTVNSAAFGKGNRWRARYVDDEGKEHAKGFARKADAQQWLDKIVSSQVTGSYVDPQLGKVTFNSFYRDWSTRQVWESNTRDNMDHSVRTVTFGDITLGDLRPSHIEAWVKALQDQGLQPSTIRTRFVNVRGVIRAAVRDRLMARDVAERTRLPRQRKAAAAMQIPTVEEVGAMLTQPGWISTFVALCAFAGLRRGEAIALQVADVNFLRREINVRRQAQWAGDGRLEVRRPKYSSERTVFIPKELSEMVSEHIRLRCPGDDPVRWLFIGRDAATPVHYAAVGRAWRELRGDLEHRLHDLRHFYASGLIAAGCDVVTVQRALGHASAAMTLSTYSHLWPDASDRTRKAAGEMLSAALESGNCGRTADGTAKNPS